MYFYKRLPLSTFCRVFEFEDIRVRRVSRSTSPEEDQVPLRRPQPPITPTEVVAARYLIVAR